MKNDNAIHDRDRASRPRRRGQNCFKICLLVLLWVVFMITFMSALKFDYRKNRFYQPKAISLLGSLRTMIGTYQFEYDRLPGLPHNADGSLDMPLADVANHPGGVSVIVKGATPLQSFVESVQEDGESRYEPSVYTTLSPATNIMLQVDAANVPASLTNHFARHLEVDTRELTGDRLRPKDFQYRVMSGGYQTSSYAYVIGAFGDGEGGLPAETGYAVIEVVNSVAEVTYLGVWERYKPVALDSKQIVMVDAEEARKFFNCETPKQAAEMNLCWVGDTEALMSGDKARVEKAIEELKQAGWEFEGK